MFIYMVVFIILTIHILYTYNMKEKFLLKLDKAIDCKLWKWIYFIVLALPIIPISFILHEMILEDLNFLGGNLSIITKKKYYASYSYKKYLYLMMSFVFIPTLSLFLKTKKFYSLLYLVLWYVFVIPFRFPII